MAEPDWVQDDVDRTFHRLHPDIDPLATDTNHTEANTDEIREVDPNFPLGALNLAIFCLNSYIEPQASRTADLVHLDEAADLAVETLARLRDAIRGFPAEERDRVAKLLAQQQEPPQDDWFMYRQDAEEVIAVVEAVQAQRATPTTDQKEAPDGSQ